MWILELHGGDYDGWAGSVEQAPEPVLVAWYCRERRACEGHATFDVGDPRIVLARAQAYRLVDTDEPTRTAFYEVGDVTPGHELEEQAAVPVGAVTATHEDGTVSVRLSRPRPAPAGWTAAATTGGNDSARALGIVLCLAPAWVCVVGVALRIAGVL